ncbi:MULTISPECIES: RES family NAD+ phosphorylase [unclassified Thioalkalivibrio]|uniref:RES family NAD+ phosphorylase n=1 Tax=unclassified Thioalkalivibrio TaxID=2621013 RepID=UPI00037E96F7|nr:MULTISPECIES: RES family NAD+ phosphorylase [unclassified Thioalkalivibrio]
MPDWNALIEAAPRVTLRGEVLRLVESQEQVATNQLVSSLDRQAVLEAMLEATKPPLRPGTERLHYLLATPFRYPPLRHGSRFGRRHEPSLFYGALRERTVLAEAAFYRFVFWYGMATPPPSKLDTQHTLFAARYQSVNGLQLHQPPFAEHADLLRHPADYQATQALGAALRETDIDLFEYASARDPHGGPNLALFDPRPFTRLRPTRQDAWLCQLTADHVRFLKPRDGALHDLPLTQFHYQGRLPLPA